MPPDPCTIRVSNLISEDNGEAVKFVLPTRAQWVCSTEKVRKGHCHAFLGGLDPGQAPLKTLLLMLRLT